MHLCPDSLIRMDNNYVTAILSLIVVIPVCYSSNPFIYSIRLDQLLALIKYIMQRQCKASYYSITYNDNYDQYSQYSQCGQHGPCGQNGPYGGLCGRYGQYGLYSQYMVNVVSMVSVVRVVSEK